MVTSEKFSMVNDNTLFRQCARIFPHMIHHIYRDYKFCNCAKVMQDLPVEENRQDSHIHREDEEVIPENIEDAADEYGGEVFVGVGYLIISIHQFPSEVQGCR